MKKILLTLLILLIVISAISAIIPASAATKCPRINNAAKRFPIHNKYKICGILRMLRTFAKIEWTIWEDGSLEIYACIPTMGCSP